MIDRLPQVINKTAIYYKILPELTECYKYLQKGQQTAVSLVETESIYSNAIPLFMTMLNLLKSKSGCPVYLELAYNPKLLAFLDSIGFFSVLKRYNIAEYEEGYLGGFNNYCDYERLQRNVTKIFVNEPYIYFEEWGDAKKKRTRDTLSGNVKSMLRNTPFFRSETTPIRGDQLWENTLTAATELIVNAQIHSHSLSYAYMQMGIPLSPELNGYILTIADAGRGFYESIGERIKKGGSSFRRQREEFYIYAECLGINVKKEINFLSIMEALYYSQMQARDMDLYRLKNLLAVSKATLRIHQKNTEVVFTYAACQKCENRDILNCVQCVWARRNTKNSPLKKYPISMAGVHVEVEFVQEKKHV